jgi:hypothetical protein
LLVGGVLVGSDLINAAQIRSQIRQFDELNAGVATFQLKYGSLPGDLTPGPAAAAGFEPRTGNNGRGNGDGVIMGWDGTTPNGIVQGGETMLFWTDLSSSGFINASITGAAPVEAILQNAPASWDTVLFKGKMGGHIAVFSCRNKPKCSGRNNFFHFANFTDTGGTAVWGLPVLNHNLTVSQAEDIDKKIDNGLPNSGIIMSCDGPANVGGKPGTGTTLDWLGAAPVNGNCTMGTGNSDVYATASNGSRVNCNITYGFY